MYAEEVNEWHVAPVGAVTDSLLDRLLRIELAVRYVVKSCHVICPPWVISNLRYALEGPKHDG